MLMSQIFWRISGILLQFPWRQNKKSVSRRKPSTNTPGSKDFSLGTHRKITLGLIPSHQSTALSTNMKFFNERLRSVSNHKWRDALSFPHIFHSLFFLTGKVHLWRDESIVAAFNKRLFSKIFLKGSD